MHLGRFRLAFLGVAVGAAVVGAVPAPVSALNDPFYARQWGLQVIGAKTAWDAGLLGEGIDIAILDTGVHLQHQDLEGRLVAGRNYVTPGAPPQDDQCDDDAPDSDPTECADGGHGTHVAGIAAASIDNGGTVGVAPKARIMPVKVLGQDGSGSFSNAANAIRWATDNGAEIINLSLGSDIQGLSGSPEILNDAVRYAWSKGSLCVFAAGNSFVLGSGFSDEPALVVSATNRSDAKPDFSSGVGAAKWALAAPGGGDTVQFAEDENILSTVWTSDRRRDTYVDKRGTSMSAPFVAGAAAVLRGAGLTPQQTVDRLLSTAKDLGPAGRDNTFGAGRLDLAKASAGLRAAPASTVPNPAPTPAPVDPSAPNPSASGGSGGSPTTTARPASGRTSPATQAPSQPAPTAAPTPGPTAAPGPEPTLAPVEITDEPVAIDPVARSDDDNELAATDAESTEGSTGFDNWALAVLAGVLLTGTGVGAFWRRRADRA